MKVFKITVTILLAAAALAYAAKIPVVFCEGLEGFAKPPVVPDIYESEGVTYVDFGEKLGPKGKLQFTKVQATNICLEVGQVKAIAQKGGKVIGAIDSIVSTDPDLLLKLKGITVGTVIASGVKKAQVGALLSELAAGTFAAGTAVKATTSVAGELTGIYKNIACGWFDGEVDASEITTPKKVNLKAKVNQGGIVYLPAGIVYKAKNVQVVTE